MFTKKLNKCGACVIAFSCLLLSAFPGFAKEPALADMHLGVRQLLDGQTNIGRLGLQSIQSPDEKTAYALELQLLQILQEEGIDVLTPAKVKQQLSQAEQTGEMPKADALWADHLILGEATTTGSQIMVSLRLLKVTTGEIVSNVTAIAGAALKESSLEAQTIRGAVERLADALYVEMGKLPGNVRYQRVAVMTLEEIGTATKNLGLGKYLQQEMSMAFKDRGYLTVERARLNEAVGQMGVAQALSAENAPAMGQMLGAQILVLGTVTELGNQFVITSRVLDAQNGTVLGAAEIKANRNNVVTLGSGLVDTRTSGGAVFRAAVLPGWGHYYYQRPMRGMLWAVSTYGSALMGVGLFSAAYSQEQAYKNFEPDDGEAGPETQAALTASREQANSLYTAAAVGGGLAGVLWLSNLLDAYAIASALE